MDVCVVARWLLANHKPCESCKNSRPSNQHCACVAHVLKLVAKMKDPLWCVRENSLLTTPFKMPAWRRRQQFPNKSSIDLWPRFATFHRAFPMRSWVIKTKMMGLLLGRPLAASREILGTSRICTFRPLYNRQITKLSCSTLEWMTLVPSQIFAAAFMREKEQQIFSLIL